MADIVDSVTRSRIMTRVKGKNTRLELLIRKGLHSRGFRYRLHHASLPGKPDMVFPKYRAIIFINGCFWHGHECTLFSWPKTRKDFWKDKIEKNRTRDHVTITRLQEKGWRTLVIWECALRGPRKKPMDEVLDECSSWIIGSDSATEIQGDPA